MGLSLQKSLVAADGVLQARNSAVWSSNRVTHWPLPLQCAALSTAAWLKSSATHRQQVENGLLPALVTPRTAPKKLSLRMRQRQVPGLRGAVVDHGQLVQAHARGMGQPTQALKTDTLIPATSLSKPVSAVAAAQTVAQGRTR